MALFAQISIRSTAVSIGWSKTISAVSQIIYLRVKKRPLMLS